MQRSATAVRAAVSSPDRRLSAEQLAIQRASTHALAFSPRPGAPPVSPWTQKKREDAAKLSWLRWAFHFQHSPTQPSAQLAPSTFAMRVFWILMLFSLILSTIPVTDVSVSTQGVVQFVNNVYYKSLAGHDEKLADVDTVDDMVAFQRALVGSLFPTHQYGEEPRGRLQLYLLRVDRLMNSVVLSQRRVKPTNCAYSNVEELYPTCYEDIRPDTEVTKGYHDYEYDPMIGGFYHTLPLNRTTALGEFDGLVEKRFWDEATRESTMRFAFMNAPGHFSGYCTLTFDISPYGKVSHGVDVQFLRLQPYSSKVGGETLVYIQVAALAFVAAMVAEIVSGFIFQPHVRYRLAYVLRPWMLVDLAIFGLMWYGVSAWMTFISGPERDAFNPEHPQFKLIAALSAEFQNVMLYMSLVLLISVLRTLEYIVLVEELCPTYVSIAGALVQIAWFMILFVIIVGGFILSGHVMFGTQLPMFQDIKGTTQNMMLWLLSLGGGHEDLFAQAGGFFFLALFLMICMVLLFNIVLAIVFMAFDSRDDMDDHQTKSARPYNHVIADWLCDAHGVTSYKQDYFQFTPHGSDVDSKEDLEKGSSDDEEEAPLLDPAPASAR